MVNIPKIAKFKTVKTSTGSDRVKIYLPYMPWNFGKIFPDAVWNKAPEKSWDVDLNMKPVVEKFLKDQGFHILQDEAPLVKSPAKVSTPIAPVSVVVPPKTVRFSWKNNPTANSFLTKVAQNLVPLFDYTPSEELGKAFLISFNTETKMSVRPGPIASELHRLAKELEEDHKGWNKNKDNLVLARLFRVSAQALALHKDSV